MPHIPFEKLYHTEFYISDTVAKPQYWVSRGNCYNALDTPKISHTLLWMKNCSAVITDKTGTVITADKNQLVYTAKGTRYRVDFKDTGKGEEDTVVLHFQMTDKNLSDILPADRPFVCIKNVDSFLAEQIEKAVAECQKNVVCFPEVNACLYKILSVICQKQKRRTLKRKFAVILSGIELLEENADLSIEEIAERTGVSLCYFRRLFKEYSGETPISFRQHCRIEKAKGLLLSEEDYSVGEIAQMLGFSDIYHFSKTFKKFCGVSPATYKNNRGIPNAVTAKDGAS